MAGHRRVRLFRIGHDQAVRIPAEFALPGREATIHRDGDRLVIEPVSKRGLLALLGTMKPLDEPFPRIDDLAPVPEQRTFFLDDAAHARFLALLDSPPAPSAQVRARVRRKAPWEG